MSETSELSSYMSVPASSADFFPLCIFSAGSSFRNKRSGGFTEKSGTTGPPATLLPMPSPSFHATSRIWRSITWLSTSESLLKITGVLSWPHLSHWQRRCSRASAECTTCRCFLRVSKFVRLALQPLQRQGNSMNTGFSLS